MWRSEWKCQASDTQNEGAEIHVLLIQASTLGSSRDRADSELYTCYQLLSARPNPSPWVWQRLKFGSWSSVAWISITVSSLGQYSASITFCNVCTHTFSTYPHVYPYFLRQSLNLLWSIWWKVCTQMLSEEAFQTIHSRRKKASHLPVTLHLLSDLSQPLH